VELEEQYTQQAVLSMMLMHSIRFQESTQTIILAIWWTELLWKWTSYQDILRQLREDDTEFVQYTEDDSIEY